MYLLVTQLIVIFHFLFIAFVVFGGFWAIRRRLVLIVHLSSLIWAIYAELSPGVVCPLTSLENYCASRAGMATYKEAFITRHCIPIIYQEDLSLYVQFLIVGVVIGVNVFTYRKILRRLFRS